MASSPASETYLCSLLRLKLKLLSLIVDTVWICKSIFFKDASYYHESLISSQRSESPARGRRRALAARLPLVGCRSGDAQIRGRPWKYGPDQGTPMKICVSYPVGVCCVIIFFVTTHVVRLKLFRLKGSEGHDCRTLAETKVNISPNGWKSNRW